MSADWNQFSRAVREGAHRYFNRDGAKHSERLLREAMAGQYKFKNFGAEPIQLDKFGWDTPGKDRNWWWQLQQLSLLDKAARVWDEPFRTQVLQFNRAVLETWTTANRCPSVRNLAWHDHASAFRLKNLTLWLLYLCWCGARDDHINSVYDLVIGHIRFFSDQENYSENTNHGYDQSLYMLLAVSVLNSRGESLTDLERLAKSRVLAEIEFGFTHQGVHVENSPGYQESMLGRLAEAKWLIDLGFIPRLGSFDQLIRSGRRFLGQLLDEQSRLPIIGDTQAHVVCKKHTDVSAGFDANGFFDYCASGYFLARQRAARQKRCHLVFKAGHLSSYHRHDDDLAINLRTPTGTLIGDAGLYTHNEGNSVRRFCRSNLGHSTLFPTELAGRTANRDPATVPSPAAMRRDGARVWATSYIYEGLMLRRELDLGGFDSGRLLCTDSCETLGGGSKEVMMMSNFLIPEPSEIGYIRNGVRILCQGGAFTISSNVSVSWAVLMNREKGRRMALYSPRYGEIAHACRVVARWRQDSGPVGFNISIG